MGMKPPEYAVVRNGAKLRAQRENVAKKSLRKAAADMDHPGAHTFLHRLETGQRTTCDPVFAWHLSFAYQIPMHAFEDYFELHGTTASVA